MRPFIERSCREKMDRDQHILDVESIDQLNVHIAMTNDLVLCQSDR